MHRTKLPLRVWFRAAHLMATHSNGMSARQLAGQMDIPTIELGFPRGQREPELFIQDNPSMGSMFFHDKTTYKIRHVYGATVLDYRGLYKAVVP